MSSLFNRPIDVKAKLDAAANALASVTFAAVAGQKHRCFAVHWSYNAAPTGGKLTVKDDATAIFELDITAAGPGSAALPPIIGSANTQMVIELAAGGAAVTGKLTAAVYTAV